MRVRSVNEKEGLFIFSFIESDVRPSSSSLLLSLGYMSHFFGIRLLALISFVGGACFEYLSIFAEWFVKIVSEKENNKSSIELSNNIMIFFSQIGGKLKKKTKFLSIVYHSILCGILHDLARLIFIFTNRRTVKMIHKQSVE